MATPLELRCELTLAGEALSVLRLEAREALDEVPIATCRVTNSHGGPSPADVIGKSVVLTLAYKDGDSTRTIAGYVAEAHRATLRGDEPEEQGTALVVRPRLHRLSHRTDCRTFQDVAAPDIAEKVLRGVGLAPSDHLRKLSGTYPKRVYTAQYRETDLDFFRRLLAEEGIGFAVDASSGSDVVLLFDGDLGDVDGAKGIPFGLGDGLDAHRAIGALTQEIATAPGRVHLRDYDFERPRLGLDAKALADEAAEQSLEVYAYPGRFTDPAVGDRYAKVTLDALRCRRELVRAVTSSLRLLPGRRFQLEGHPYAPLNREHLVLATEIVFDARRHGAREGSRISFTAIPTEKTTYRPPRVARAVSSPGAQVAVTTGAPGEEIHPDGHGRVKVLFPWDRLGKRDDTSSLWIRTCQLPLGGSMLTPRVGWEVYLNFTDGDPDEPFVFGRMYNALAPPPYALPKHKKRMAIQTATTPGGGSTNELRMDDKAGGEEMFMGASKDASVSAGNNATESVGNNETRSIGANQSLAVTAAMSASIGANQSVTVGGSQSVHVSTFMVDDVGSHALSIGGGRDVKAGGDHKRTVTGASSLNVSSMQVDLVAGSADEQTMATMDDDVGAAFVELTASNRTMTVKGSRVENAGAAKIILSAGGRAVKVGGDLKHRVGAAIVTSIKADRADESAGDFVEVAAGAQLIKADNVVFEASSLLSVVMGASTITLTPASVSIAGAKITLDGECDETGLVKDN